MSGKSSSAKSVSSKLPGGQRRGLLGGVMRGLGHVGKKPVRFKYEIYVDRLHGLRNGRYKVRFSRGPKGVETNVKAMDDAESNTMVIFEQKTLGMYTTLYKDEKGKNFDTKDFKLSLIEVRNDGGKRTDRLAGATVLNLGDYAGVPSRSTDKTLKLGAGVTASVKITSTFVMDGAEKLEGDNMSESSLSGDSYDEEDEEDYEESIDESGNVNSMGITLPEVNSQDFSEGDAPRSSTSFQSDRRESVHSTDRREVNHELVNENERLKRDLEEKDREIQKYGALVRTVSSKSMETQLEAEAKFDELQMLNSNLNVELERVQAELEKVRLDEASNSTDRAGPSLNNEIESMHLEKIRSLEANLKTLQDEKRSTRSKIKAHEHHQERLKATYKNLSDMYNKLRVDYANLAKKYKSAKVKAVSSQTSTLQAVAQELEREKIRRERDDVVDELNRLRSDQFGEIESAKRERAQALKELEVLKKTIDQLEESETEIRRIVAERDTKSRELDTLNVTVAAEVERVKEEKNSLERDLNESSAQAKKLEEEISVANEKLTGLEKALELSSVKEKDAVDGLQVLQESSRVAAREKDDEIGTLKTERDKLLNELVVASKKNMELRNSGQDRATLINELETLRRQMDDDNRRHQRVEDETKLLIEEGSAEMKRVSEELETALLKMELAENSYGAEIRGLQVELDEAHEKIQLLMKEHHGSLEELELQKKSAEARALELEKENEAANIAFSSKVEKAGKELEETRTRNLRDHEALKETHSVALGGMEREFREKYGRVCTERDSLQKNLFEISEQLDNARTDLEVARDSMKSDVQSARVELDAAIQEIDRLSKNSTELEEKNEALESSVRELEESKGELVKALHTSEEQLSGMRDDYKRKLAEKDAELDERTAEQEKLEQEARARQEIHRKEADDLKAQLNRSVEDAKVARTKLESQLAFATREKEEYSRELELVQSQNYEERTQALSTEVSKAREERDSKVVELTSLQEEKNTLDISIREQQTVIDRLEGELISQKTLLDEALAKNRSTLSEMKIEHQRAVAEEEERRKQMALELRMVKEQLSSAEMQVKEFADRGYDDQISRLQNDLDSATGEKSSISLELDQTRQLLAKRTATADSEKAKAGRDVNTLRKKVLETEEELGAVLEKLQTVEEDHRAALDSVESERRRISEELLTMKQDAEARQVDSSALSQLEETKAKLEYEYKVVETQKEQLAKTLADEQARLREVESERTNVEEELRKVKRDSAAEIKRAGAERDDAVVLLQKTRAAAKGSEGDVSLLRKELNESQRKSEQANQDVLRMKEERDKVLKDMDELQSSFVSQKGAADAASDKKGRNTEAQLRAAYARERTLQTRITSLIEENKVLKDGIKKGDSFDSVLNDLVQVKVALAIAEEDKLLLQDELRKYKGTDVIG